MRDFEHLTAVSIKVIPCGMWHCSGRYVPVPVFQRDVLPSFSG